MDVIQLHIHNLETELKSLPWVFQSWTNYVTKVLAREIYASYKMPFQYLRVFYLNYSDITITWLFYMTKWQKNYIQITYQVFPPLKSVCCLPA